MAQPQQPPTDPANPQQPPPPTLTNPRFTLELEFVSSLANPYYLSHLAVNYPNLLGISQSTDETDATDTKDTTTPRDPDAAAFAAYLAYLYSYWKTPEYAQFLTHPGATLRALRLLQEENFRRDVIRPDVVEALASNGLQEQVVEGDKPQGEEQQQDQSEQQDGKGS